MLSSAAVAKLVVHQPLNPEVVGSSPTWYKIFPHGCAHFGIHGRCGIILLRLRGQLQNCTALLLWRQSWRFLQFRWRKLFRFGGGNWFELLIEGLSFLLWVCYQSWVYSQRSNACIIRSELDIGPESLLVAVLSVSSLCSRFLTYGLCSLRNTRWVSFFSCWHRYSTFSQPRFLLFLSASSFFVFFVRFRSRVAFTHGFLCFCLVVFLGICFASRWLWLFWMCSTFLQCLDHLSPLALA